MELESKNDNTEGEKEVRPRRRLLFFWVILLAVMAGALFFIYRWVNQPSIATIHEQKIVTAETERKTNEKERFESQHLSFAHSTNYVLKKHDLAKDENSTILEQAFFAGNSSISKKIALTVYNLPSRNLEDLSDYKFREINSKLYRKETFSEGKIKGTSFVSIGDNSFEKTFFFVEGELLAVISMSAPAFPDETLNNEASEVVKSVEWRK